jgi:hypothetical protein
MARPFERTPPASREQSELGLGLEQRLKEMRHLLASMAPRSTGDALRLLRDAFPDVPLDRRVRALSDLKRH